MPRSEPRLRNILGRHPAHFFGTELVNRRVYCRGARGPVYNFARDKPFAQVGTALVIDREPACPMRTLTSIEELDFAAAMPATVVVQKTSDHVLLEETLAGDEDAFAELVRRYRNQITSYIYRMTNDYDGAVDLAQEAFLRVYRAANRYQTTHAFSTYIYRNATNLAISV